MKTAYQYIRISQEDQSHFSISGQQAINEDFAEKHDITIVGTFTDDGYSARSFNRPEWKKLESYLINNKHEIDYLIVTKYDRLIRNVKEGLVFIEKLEEKWDIKLLSVLENFSIDPHSALFFKMRTDLLVNAEFESRVISDRSKFGIWSAKRQGRFIGRAPFGYKNSIDDNNKPVIVVDETKMKVIQQIFSDYLAGVSFFNIMKNVRQNGFSLKGHGALKCMLANHVYAGLIYVPSYKDELPRVIKGLHAGIISENVFWEVSQKIQGKAKIQTKIFDENIPLRRFILCQSCRKILTGGKSRGRSAFYYYYRCPRCTGENYNARRAHAEMTELLNQLSLDKDSCETLLKKLINGLDNRSEQRIYETKNLEAECILVRKKIFNLEDKYINNKIGITTYRKWYATYKRELHNKLLAISDLNKGMSGLTSLYKRTIPYLSDLNWVYTMATAPLKQQLLQVIFPDKLIKTKEGYRTVSINPIFFANAVRIKGLINQKKTEEQVDNPISSVCTPNGNQIEPLFAVIECVLAINKCA